MAKKYLVYIHESDKFDELTSRGEKSGLINELLEKHWANEGKPNIIKVPAEARERVGKGVGSCIHGAAPGFCKNPKCPNSKRV